ncbi:MAG: N-acetylmuramic acid 6-phosphate etherase [Bacteroidota bacterium]
MSEKESELFRQLEQLATEQRNPNTFSIDVADAHEIAKSINVEDQKVAGFVEQRIPVIASAIDRVAAAFAVGGRLLYFGAGTSGRLGVLDAAECPPTFGTPPEQVVGYIAGGKEAMFAAQEGAEDSEDRGKEDVEHAEVTSIDVVCGIAASGRTPYVHGAIKEGIHRNCNTMLITTVPADQVTIEPGLMIDIPVGPEVIMGSTRMKSATAQKMVLNMLTTGAMIRQGKIYENVMVDLMLTNSKLVERAKRIVMYFSTVGYREASDLLEQTNGKVKPALFMAITGLNLKDAVRCLTKTNGFIRKALQEYNSDSL